MGKIVRKRAKKASAAAGGKPSLSPSQAKPEARAKGQLPSAAAPTPPLAKVGSGRAKADALPFSVLSAKEPASYVRLALSAASAARLGGMACLQPAGALVLEPRASQPCYAWAAAGLAKILAMAPLAT